MPRVERIQYPVGQGGFFAEHHLYDQRTVVYDCGAGSSAHPTDVLKNQIAAFHQRTDRIDALIISHFHSDHLNGIEKLMTGIRHGARRVFIPYLTPDEQILVTIEALLPIAGQESLQATRETLALILRWTRGRGRDLPSGNGWTVVEMTSEGWGEDSRETESRYLGDTRNDGQGFLADHTPIALFQQPSPWEDWILKFFNKKVATAAIQQCLLALRAIDGFDSNWLNSDLDRLVNWLRKRGNLTKIQKAYAAISGKLEHHNLVSLCCYSGPSEECRWHWHGHACIPAQWPIPTKLESPEPHRLGWLGTGDIQLKDVANLAEFQRRYASVSPLLGVIQVPHHGSMHNSDQRLFAQAPMVATVAYGTNNDYHHPDGQVILDAQRLGVTVWPVTEQPHTAFHQHIFWR